MAVEEPTQKRARVDAEERKARVAVVAGQTLGKVPRPLLSEAWLVLGPAGTPELEGRVTNGAGAEDEAAGGVRQKSAVREAAPTGSQLANVVKNVFGWAAGGATFDTPRASVVPEERLCFIQENWLVTDGGLRASPERAVDEERVARPQAP